jgi:hypothetical protein
MNAQYSGMVRPVLSRNIPQHLMIFQMVPWPFFGREMGAVSLDFNQKYDMLAMKRPFSSGLNPFSTVLTASVKRANALRRFPAEDKTDFKY